jgi:hypothetical protein
LLAALEIAGGDPTILVPAAIAFVIARIAHGFGMDGRAAARLRMLGMMRPRSRSQLCRLCDPDGFVNGKPRLLSRRGPYRRSLSRRLRAPQRIARASVAQIPASRLGSSGRPASVILDQMF